MISARFVPVAFGFVLSCLMSFVVSGIATFRAAGLIDGLFAFPVVLFVAPVARRIVIGMVKA